MRDAGLTGLYGPNAARKEISRCAADLQPRFSVLAVRTCVPQHNRGMLKTAMGQGELISLIHHGLSSRILMRIAVFVHFGVIRWLGQRYLVPEIEIDSTLSQRALAIPQGLPM